MNLARHRLGLLGDRAALPDQGHLPRDLLAGRQRPAPSSATVLRRHFPWCAEWEAELRAALRRLRRGEAGERRPRLRRPPALLGGDDAGRRRSPPRSARASTTCSSTSTRTPTGCRRRSCSALKPDGRGRHRGRRRRPVDLRLPRGGGAQHPRLPRPLHPARPHRRARAELPLDAGDPRRRQRGDRRGRRGLRSSACAATGRPGRGRRSSRSATRRARSTTSAAQILDAREAGTALKEQAVLFRTAHHSGPLEVELVRRNIPFVKFGGLKFLDSGPRQGRARLPALRPEPRRPGRRLPRAAARARHRRRRRPRPLLDAMARRRSRRGAAGAAVPRRAAADWAAFAALSTPSAPAAADWPGELAAVRAWYDAPPRAPARRRAGPRRADLLQLEAIAASFPGRERFLTEITLDPPGAVERPRRRRRHRDEDYLILSTIHSAKGQEWRRVFVLNCVDGCIPSDLGTGTSAEIDEERRLLYVAMTRARDTLHLVAPQRFHVHGQHRARRPPRLRDPHPLHPDPILDRFDRTTWPLAPAAAGGAAPRRTAPPSTSPPACGRCGSRLPPPVALGVAALPDAALAHASRPPAGRSPLTLRPFGQKSGTWNVHGLYMRCTCEHFGR